MTMTTKTTKTPTTALTAVASVCRFERNPAPCRSFHACLTPSCFCRPRTCAHKKQRSPRSRFSATGRNDRRGRLCSLTCRSAQNAMPRVNPTGRFGVEAGGNRYLAIDVLDRGRDRGRASTRGQCEVPSQLVEADRAMGVSLARKHQPAADCIRPINSSRHSAKLIAEGKTTVAQVAAHFGITQAIDVERRMRLARVAPTLFQLYREDKIDLDAMMALATHR